MAYRRDEPQQSLFSMYRGFAVGTVIFAIAFALISEEAIAPRTEKGDTAAPDKAELAAPPKKTVKNEQRPVAGFFDEEPSEEIADETPDDTEETATDDIDADMDGTVKRPAMDLEDAPQIDSADATLP